MSTRSSTLGFEAQGSLHWRLEVTAFNFRCVPCRSFWQIPLLVGHFFTVPRRKPVAKNGLPAVLTSFEVSPVGVCNVARRQHYPSAPICFRRLTPGWFCSRLAWQCSPAKYICFRKCPNFPVGRFFPKGCSLLPAHPTIAGRASSRLSFGTWHFDWTAMFFLLPFPCCASSARRLSFARLPANWAVPSIQNVSIISRTVRVQPIDRATGWLYPAASPPTNQFHGNRKLH